MAIQVQVRAALVKVVNELDKLRGHVKKVDSDLPHGSDGDAVSGVGFLDKVVISGNAVLMNGDVLLGHGIEIVC